MTIGKVKVEIYEGDPFRGCCGPGIASPSAVERLRKMLMERNETVKTVREEFKEQVEIERQIVSSRKRYGMSKAAMLSWLMGQPYDIPNMVATSRIVRWKVVLTYAAMAWAFSVMFGLTYGFVTKSL